MVLIYVCFKTNLCLLPPPRGICWLDSVEDEEEPPARNETLIPIGQVGDQWDDFVSVAVLQANETGALVSVVENGQKNFQR